MPVIKWINIVVLVVNALCCILSVSIEFSPILCLYLDVSPSVDVTLFLSLSLSSLVGTGDWLNTDWTRQILGESLTLSAGDFPFFGNGHTTNRVISLSLALSNISAFSSSSSSSDQLSRVSLGVTPY